MGNFQIKIDVSKIDKNSLYKGEKGTYLTLDCIELKQTGQYGDTHMVKQVYSKEAYSVMSEERRKAIPILGNMKPNDYQPKASTTQDAAPTYAPQPSSDLPF